MHIPASSTEYEEVQQEKSSLAKLLMNLRSGKSATAKEEEKKDTDLKQRAVREGFKLRNIKNTLLMTDLVHSDFNVSS